MKVSPAKSDADMLAVDTNIVVRYLLGGSDDKAQFAKAVDLIECGTVFVSATVLLETEWVLRAVYDLAPSSVVAALESFVGLPGIKVENVSGVGQALVWMRDGFDFADALHVASAYQSDEFVTFDKALAKSAKTATTKPRVRLA